MNLPEFIKIETTKEAAMAYRNSPQMEFYSFRGVQLLPEQESYRQRTYASDGISLEGYSSVEVFDICGNLLPSTIDAAFGVVEAFNDPNTGLPQVIWELENVDDDFGDQLIYLRIGVGDSFYYSSPFYLTAVNQEYTAKFYYRNIPTQTYLSIGLNIWYKSPDTSETLTTYDTVSTNVRRTIINKNIEFEYWQTDVIDILIFGRIKKMFSCRDLYLWDYTPGELPVRCGMFETFDTPLLEGKENFAEAELTLTFDKNDVLGGDEPTPPPPPPQLINLTEVVLSVFGRNQVQYTFDYSGFTPDYFMFQWSLDQVSWSQIGQQSTSPQYVNVFNPGQNDYYYRIFYPNLNLASNIVQIVTKEIDIFSVVNTGSGYIVAFSLIGFEITQGFIQIEVTNDNGASWYDAQYENSNTSPKGFTVPFANPLFTKFRLKYEPFGVYSDITDLP